METTEVAADRWFGRPWLSRLVRFSVYAIPFVCSIFAALALSRLIPPAHTWPVAIARLIAIAASSTIVLYGVDRLTRRMLPLAALLGLTLVFPDEAPSRFKIAMRAGGTNELQRRLVDYRRLGADEPALAAQRLLELVADLSRHDRLTRGHSERVRAYAQMIGEELGLSEAEIDSLRWAALLHDIGKLEIPFEILNKPSALTSDEYDTIKLHPAIGARLAAPLAGWLGPSIRAVGEHHERWDGRGYPNGLRGTDISHAARIVAVADTFDVMTSVRSYKKPGTAAEARAELARCAGTQFDANVVRAFLSISLGKLRLAMGPLSWLTQLAFFPPGLAGATAAAPALMAVAGMSAAALGTATTPFESDQRPPSAAAISLVDLSDTVDHSTVTVTVPTAPGDTTRASDPGGQEQNVDGTADGSTATTTTVPTVSVEPTSTTVGAPARPGDVDGHVVDQTVPVRGGPTTTLPKNGAAPQSPSSTNPPVTPTVPATPATTAPPAPTTAPATTVATTTPPPTTAPATTTTLPPPPAGTTYLLGSSAAGNVSSQSVLPLVTRAPLNPGALPNLDTDRDNKPGRVLKQDDFFGFAGTDKLQRFRLDPAATIQLNGQVELVLFAAAKDFHPKSIQAQAMLLDCVDALGLCSTFATATVTFDGGDDFAPQTFDFGVQSRSIAASHNLELWIVVPKASGGDMWCAYDTAGYESALTIGA